MGWPALQPPRCMRPTPHSQRISSHGPAGPHIRTLALQTGRQGGCVGLVEQGPPHHALNAQLSHLLGGCRRRWNGMGGNEQSVPDQLASPQHRQYALQPAGGAARGSHPHSLHHAPACTTLSATPSAPGCFPAASPTRVKAQVAAGHKQGRLLALGRQVRQVSGGEVLLHTN